MAVALLGALLFSEKLETVPFTSNDRLYANNKPFPKVNPDKVKVDQNML